MFQYLLLFRLLSYRSTPAAHVRHSVISAVAERSRKVGPMEVEICRLYDASVYEIWEMPRLHIAFSQDEPSFWNSFHSAKKSELEETDALGRDLLCLAAIDGNLKLGILELP